ncbi:molybdopterin/thiamine biosynthesis adenylyltransferase/rhodanese-related sulfurtransferase [Pedobacter sp. UYP24]
MNSERYNRQLILKGFGEEAQERLSNASVLVIGAGGLGCPALQYLAGAGIGHIGIVDNDVVSLSNLHRQILFTTDDIGKLKATTAVERISALNPEIKVTAYPLRLERKNILELISGFDYVLDGTDNFESRYLINDACFLLKKPVVFAAVSGYEGQIAVFHVADGNNAPTNYRDIFPVMPLAGELPNCEENGVLGVLPGIIGTMQAAETIKLIAKIGNPLINRLLNYNLLTQVFYEIKLNPAHDTYAMPDNESEFMEDKQGVVEGNRIQHFIDIDGDQLLDFLKMESTLVIDVREPHEYPKLNESLFRQVPIALLPELLNEDLQQQNIVFICQHGIRSEAAAEAMKEKYGFHKNIFNLKGGISRWMQHFIALT